MTRNVKIALLALGAVALTSCYKANAGNVNAKDEILMQTKLSAAMYLNNHRQCSDLKDRYKVDPIDLLRIRLLERVMHSKLSTEELSATMLASYKQFAEDIGPNPTQSKCDIVLDIATAASYPD